MEEKDNKFIIILIIIIVMAISIVGLIVWGFGDSKNENLPIQTQIAEDSMLTGSKYVSEEIKGYRVNTSEKIKETKYFDGLEVKITQLSSIDNRTTFLGTIKNTSSEKFEGSDIILIIYDDEGHELARENIGNVIQPIEANQEVELNISIINDYANAYDFKFEKATE